MVGSCEHGNEPSGCMKCGLGLISRPTSSFSRALFHGVDKLDCKGMAFGVQICTLCDIYDVYTGSSTYDRPHLDHKTLIFLLSHFICNMYR
jgi:hypothetical protein